MATRLWLGLATGVLLVACEDATIRRGPNGGAGGSAGAAAGGGGAGGNGGTTGGSAGAGGAAGNGGAAGAAPARFTAAVTGDVLLLTPLDPVWIVHCTNPIQSLQRTNGSWALLRDDRPGDINGHHSAHYLDGSYHSDCNLNLGCDYVQCRQLTSDVEPDFERLQPPALEYVQVGQSVAPLCQLEDAGVDAGALDAGPDGGGRLVPTIEGRTPGGQLGVRVRYFRDNLCQGTAIISDVPVE